MERSTVHNDDYNNDDAEGLIIFGRSAFSREAFSVLYMRLLPRLQLSQQSPVLELHGWATSVIAIPAQGFRVVVTLKFSPAQGSALCIAFEVVVISQRVAAQGSVVPRAGGTSPPGHGSVPGTPPPTPPPPPGLARHHAADGTGPHGMLYHVSCRPVYWLCRLNNLSTCGTRRVKNVSVGKTNLKNTSAHFLADGKDACPDFVQLSTEVRI